MATALTSPAPTVDDLFRGDAEGAAEVCQERLPNARLAAPAAPSKPSSAIARGPDWHQPPRGLALRSSSWPAQHAAPQCPSSMAVFGREATAALHHVGCP
eukprot:CAMPEP_0179129518 /NCGR_PEP_ID=MMETSP0796-20121207/61455_1 /TAXON_ID=73915 /ORGANISM="Pyrodinium bahamense, Strain pbaha01" /LENGTH=99 /DNA_ID=CAMNT_0020828399 /DNA_START=90 /DNA_END=389 /DNA_ORIENTATION=+